MSAILLVEDDPKLAEPIATLLNKEGWMVETADSVGSLNDLLLGNRSYSLLVLDRLLQRYDSKNLVPEIRRRWPQTPILVLSAINSPLDRAELLNLGVDDYLGKPFLNQELVARVRALSRRHKASEETVRILGECALQFDRFALRRGEKEIVLPHKEFLLLKILSRQPGKVIPKDELLTYVWGTATTGDSNVVEATINHLRRRLESFGADFRIKNLRNSGYFLEL